MKYTPQGYLDVFNSDAGITIVYGGLHQDDDRRETQQLGLESIAINPNDLDRLIAALQACKVA